MASMTFGCPWPMFTHISWLLKSRYSLPSGVQKYEPLAPATGIGSTLPCADHSYRVWRLVRAIISSPVMLPRSVSIAIRPPSSACIGEEAPIKPHGAIGPRAYTRPIMRLPLAAHPRTAYGEDAEAAVRALFGLTDG